MKPRSRWKHKGRSESGGFFRLPFAVMDSENYRALSGNAVKLLNDLGRQYIGKNNGDLCASWSVMRKRGWRSPGTLNNALKELRHYGMIEQTKQGGLHSPSLYALTWNANDECGGKLEVPATHVASGLWKHVRESFVRSEKNRSASTESVQRNYCIRTYGPKRAA